MEKLPQTSPSPSGGGFVFSVDAGGTNCRIQAFDRLLNPLSAPVKFRWDYSRIAGPFRGQDWQSAIGPAEQEAGARQVNTLAKNLSQLMTAFSSRDLADSPVCVAWPGLKCPENRSVVRCANGPRILGLVGQLREAIARFAGVGVQILPLQSDGQMAGLAEFHHSQGALQGVRDGYLMMAGTGLAEAFVVNGQLLSRAQLGLLGPFEQYNHDGRSFEELLRGAAWSKADELGAALGAWLRLRASQCPGSWQRVALGGRARPPQQPWVEPIEFPLAWSTLVDPALWGGAFFATQSLTETKIP